MSVYTPPFAPIAVLAFLGTAGLLILCLLVVVVGAFGRSRSVVIGGMGASALTVVGYTSILLGLSLASRDVEITPGAWKYFCEIDCHIAYGRGGVQFRTSVGPEMEPLSANGRFAIVELKTWFDPTTISPHRGDAPLTPNGRVVWLVDGRGRRFPPSKRSELVLASAGLDSTPLETRLRPGESYVSYLVFEIPSDVEGWRLLVTSSDAEGFLIWGAETSPWHGKAYFSLPNLPAIPGNQPKR